MLESATEVGFGHDKPQNLTILPFHSVIRLLPSNMVKWKNIFPSNSSVELAGAVGMGIGIVAGGFLTRYLADKKKDSSLSRPPYTPGNKITTTRQPPNFGNRVHIFDPSELKSSYNLMISTVTPRPIALVSSRNKETGIDNLAPFSYFGAVGHDPPMLAIGFCRKGSDRVQKDSLVNVLGQKEFAVNIISNWYIDQANHSCGLFSPDVDEFEQSGLTKGKCQIVKAPRVQEAAVTYECVLEYVHPVVNKDNQPTTEIVLARVVRIHVDESVLASTGDLSKPVVDTLKLQPLGRLGGNMYSTIGEVVDIPRPKV